MFGNSLGGVEGPYDKQSPLAQVDTKRLSKSKISRISNNTGELPIPSKLRLEQIRINNENAKLDAKLSSVRSHLPMT